MIVTWHRSWMAAEFSRSAWSVSSNGEGDHVYFINKGCRSSLVCTEGWNKSCEVRVSHFSVFTSRTMYSNWICAGRSRAAVGSITTLRAVVYAWIASAAAGSRISVPQTAHFIRHGLKIMERIPILQSGNPCRLSIDRPQCPCLRCFGRW